MKRVMRPTPRTGTLLVAALVLYFFANQTQVGWLYVMSAVMAGSIFTAAWLNRGMLSSLWASRGVQLVERAPYPDGSGVTARLPDVFHVGDLVDVRLELRSKTGSAQLKLLETCPLTDELPLQTQALYVPRLAPGIPLAHSYGVPVTQRGVQPFPALHVESRAPFGLFTATGPLSADLSLLVYPAVHPLRRLALIDRRGTLRQSRPRAGYGSETIGVRPYRPGDSPRHIHWRTSARVSQLTTKEFADDTQPTLLLALDCSIAATTSPTDFETAVKVAVSIGEYTLRSGYRLLLVLNEDTPPSMIARDVSWYVLLERLARVHQRGTTPIFDSLPQVEGAQIAFVLPHLSPALLAPLIRLRAGGADVLAVVIADIQDRQIASQLVAQGIDMRCIDGHGDWAALLGEPSTTRARMPSPVAEHAT